MSTRDLLILHWPLAALCVAVEACRIVWDLKAAKVTWDQIPWDVLHQRANRRARVRLEGA